MGRIEGFAQEANKNGQWIAGPDLTVADFWVGSLFVDMIQNKTVAFAPEKWAQSVDSYPECKAYGERFAAENAQYLA